jgi:3-phenylpropionate/trans-cinnamate dioxygenase ferredoxin reductase subunit
MNLQVLGMPRSFEHAVARGDPASGSFTLFYLEGDKIAGVNAVNAAKDIAVARRLMAANKSIDRGLLADTSVALRALLS